MVCPVTFCRLDAVLTSVCVFQLDFARRDRFAILEELERELVRESADTPIQVHANSPSGNEVCAHPRSPQAGVLTSVLVAGIHAQTPSDPPELDIVHLFFISTSLQTEQQRTFILAFI